MGVVGHDWLLSHCHTATCPEGAASPDGSDDEEGGSGESDMQQALVHWIVPD